MFDAGFLEMLLIGVIALIIVGPERLPKVARTIGYWVGKAKGFVATTRSDIEREFQNEEMRDLINKQSREINELRDMVSDNTQSIHDKVLSASENLVDPTPFKAEPEKKKNTSAISNSADKQDS